MSFFGLEFFSECPKKIPETLCIGHAKSDQKVRDGVSSDDGDQRRNLDDQLKRMERDNNRKQQELLLQAENAFKLQEEAYNVELVKLKTGMITGE